MGVLPKIKVIIKAWDLVVFRQPEGPLVQLGQVVGEIALVLVEVDHGLIPTLLDGPAEGDGALGQSLTVQPVGAGAIAGSDGLPVKDHGVGDVAVSQGVQHELGLLHPLLGGDGLGEEVDTHLQSSLQGPLDVGLVEGIQEQPSLGVAAVA